MIDPSSSVSEPTDAPGSARGALVSGAPPEEQSALTIAVKRHLALGWFALGLATVLGLALETLHAFKIGAYLDVENSTRRLLFTLAHAHLGALGLVQFAYVTTLRALGQVPPASSPLFTLALALIPAGFLFAGFGAEGGDPSAAVLLVPVGAVCLLVAIVRVLALLRRTD